MPTVTQKEIESLLAQAGARIQLVEPLVGKGNTVLEAFASHLAKTKQDYQTMLPNWATVADADADRLKRTLNELLDAINRIVSDGPTTAESEMHKAYSSDTTICLLSVWAIVGTSMMLWLIWELWPGEREKVPAQQMLPLIAVFGALGGYINCLQSFGRYVGNRQLLRSWTVYYLVFPLKGAGLALLVFLFLKMGIVTIQLGDKAIKGLDTVGYCLIAGMSGLFANHAVEMLGSLLAIIFKPVTGKDELRDKQDLGVDNILTAPSNPPRKSWWRH